MEDHNVPLTTEVPNTPITEVRDDKSIAMPALQENVYGNTGLMPAIKVTDLGKYIQTMKEEEGRFKVEFKVKSYFFLYLKPVNLYER